MTENRLKSDEQIEEAAGRRMWTVGLLCLGLILRLFGAFVYMHHAPAGYFFARGLEMGYMADAFAHGHGPSSPMGGSTGPTAMFAPIYPWIVSLFFRAFGSYSFGAAMGLLALQIAVSLGTIWMTLWIARTLFNEAAARVAGAIMVCSPPLWFVPTIFWDTSISIALLTGTAALAIWVQRGHGMRAWTFFGAYTGLAAIYNPAFVPPLLVLYAGLALLALGRDSRARLRRVMLGGFCFLLLYSAWPIRNARVMHTFVPLRTAAGLDLWMGNHPGATGYLEYTGFPIARFSPQQYEAYRSMGEIAYMRRMSEQAKSAIVAHPGVFVFLSAKRFVRFWAGSGTENGSPIYVLHGVLTTCFGLGGLWMLLRQRRWFETVVFASLLLVFPLPYYITHAEFRFRLVVDPLLTVLTGYAVVRLAARVSLAGGASSKQKHVDGTEPREVAVA